jgi:hypothetical protein
MLLGSPRLHSARLDSDSRRRFGWDGLLGFGSSRAGNCPCDGSQFVVFNAVKKLLHTIFAQVVIVD